MNALTLEKQLAFWKACRDSLNKGHLISLNEDCYMTESSDPHNTPLFMRYLKEALHERAAQVINERITLFSRQIAFESDLKLEGGAE